MFRFRRYRVFLAFAFITVLALYKFGTASGTSWREAASSAAGQFKKDSGDESQVDWKPKPPPPVAQETRRFEVDVPAANSPLFLQTPPPVAPNTRLTDKKPVSPSPSPAVTEKEIPSIPTLKSDRPYGNGANTIPQISDELSSSIEPIYWTKLPQDFPVPSQSLIRLPSGKPKSMPKIQFDFPPEDATAKVDRESKLDTIRDVFKKSWNGYRGQAWLHDELTPVSGGFKDPYAGWGATLVDSLDTLWIMGLKQEFEEAVRALNKIDFTTSASADIPLFETTIRYLGGLIAAYDISGKKYEKLLEKAVELAEVLISAFDTPNRMPELFYYWRPEFASQKHRASSRVVLSEIGSMSMEFTHLAQLTGEHKYYDAIARITDLLEEFQPNTRLPGMWPTELDASGCKPIHVDKPIQQPLRAPGNEPAGKQPATVESPKVAATPTPTEQLSPEGKKYIPLDLPEPVVLAPNGQNPTWVSSTDEETVGLGASGKDKITNGDALKKRQIDVGNPTPVKTTPPACVSQGFRSISDYGPEEYTLGGMSDSTYEYLSKEWLLLGGLVDKYRTMYEQAMDVFTEYLVFRPMLPNEDDILFAGKLHVPAPSVDGSFAVKLEGESAHLTCFAGGLLAMGAKLFDRPKDLEIANRLVEGCVWGYNMTQTGIMPEAFESIICESKTKCAWNETLYNETLDPRADSRQKNYVEQVEYYEQRLVSASLWYEEQIAAMTATPTPSAPAAFEARATQSSIFADLDKRQLADLEDDYEPSVLSSTTVSSTVVSSTVLPSTVSPSTDVLSPSPALPAFPVLYSPSPPLNHEDYVENKIQEERLPPGVTKIVRREYILRPEAIESVWYMYRITGSAHWRESGWRMFLAINEYTNATYGNSAIDDVTRTNPMLLDSAQSFWFSETLKYFYLLFSEEDVVSLDEWVLNTEAHPFRRPE
ncbi:glycoside hydrolase family 47 protein [Dothidotthia symphoricarpi CBS 119687]|uniref:alpha-1,2-Mannosidase n=1 Tax=Dothidotthia symphoricarpi CBS 119687 TaxID=1392245 RepID=A0A6A6AHY7_9PLEO|nr:glycoside hydrolase family 47 protein [Dothidotthia symphoricarpi CBS 119687]KAF2130051.1 glycoside hydrolase family 47 protein [Dothidotthia symphoricarpi CBS 119687]